MSNSRGGPDKRDENSYELGDLELAPRAPRGPATGTGQLPYGEDAALPSLSGFAAPAPSNDLELEIDRGNQILNARPSGVLPGVQLHDARFDDPEDEPALDLDLEKVPVRASMPRPNSDAPVRGAVASVSPSAAPQPGRTRSGRPLDEERRARELADYGVPEGGIDPARYIIHVGLRMLALRRARVPVEERAAGLADDYERALRELGAALLNDPAVLAHPSLSERVLLVRQRQGELERVRASTEAALARHTGELELLAQELQKAQQELAPFAQAEQQAEAARERADAAVKRQRARMQRAEIELRALSKASIPPPAERVQNIELERTQQQRELDQLTAALEQATAALGRARREAASRRGAVGELERKRRQHENAARANVRGHEASVARAEHALGTVLCGLAEAAEALGLARAAQRQVESLRDSEKALDEVVDQLACYDRALRMYDREAVQRGALLWLSLLAALAALFYLL